jgi:uncharacterized protein (DUF302 family)
MFHIINSQKTINDVILRLQELAPASGFSILHHYDFQTILEDKGFPIERKAWTFELCRASMASKILAYIPLFSVMMPCRISVYEEEGTTYIATMDMLPMLELFKENDDLFQEARTLYIQLTELMDTLVI